MTESNGFPILTLNPQFNPDATPAPQAAAEIPVAASVTPATPYTAAPAAAYPTAAAPVAPAAAYPTAAAPVAPAAAYPTAAAPVAPAATYPTAAAAPVAPAAAYPTAAAPVAPAAAAAYQAAPAAAATLSMPSLANATIPSPVAKNAVTSGVASAVAAVQEAPQLGDQVQLSPEEDRMVNDFARQIDVTNSDHVLLFGADAQKKIADFSDSALAAVRTKDSGTVGDMLVNLVTEIKGFGASAEKPKGLKAIGWSPRKAMAEMTARYSKIEANVDVIATELEKHQVTLLKDISMFDQLYNLNLSYLRELTLYIIAGERRLKEIRATRLAELQAKAARTGDPVDAQAANDLASKCDRFEKKLHDLKLTRHVAIQSGPQIRLLQNNDSLLVERIQSSLSSTLPLWKSQMLIALGMHRSQEALKAQKAVTDMTNDLLKKNAEALKMGTIATAQEAERGIIDLETIAATNQSLIDTINEVVRIQSEGRTKRMETEKQMAQMESELRKKLLEVHN